ncbi:MAG: hypothetical protein NDI60_04005 [Elusimicrobiales bacterium]|nr:hypothetical protein [Elusimicrobiales bacterium]
MTLSRYFRAAAAALVLGCLFVGSSYAASTEPVKVTITQVLASPAAYDGVNIEMTGTVWRSSVTYFDGYKLTSLTMVDPLDYENEAEAIASLAAHKYVMAYLWGDWPYARRDGLSVVGVYGVSLLTVGGYRSNAMSARRAKKLGP